MENPELNPRRGIQGRNPVLNHPRGNPGGKSRKGIQEGSPGGKSLPTQSLVQDSESCSMGLAWPDSESCSRSRKGSKVKRVNGEKGGRHKP